MIDRTTYKTMMSQFPSGVTVVTAYDNNQQVVGFTANAFSALSLEPALILVCPSYDSDSYPIIGQVKQFAVHILSEHQAHIAYQFAKKGQDKSQGIAITTSANNLPIIQGCLVTLECRLWHDYAGGDHAILVGEVQAAQLSEDTSAKPLLYCRGKMLDFPAESL